MEKRTLVVILLSMAILFGYMLYSSKDAAKKSFAKIETNTVSVKEVIPSTVVKKEQLIEQKSGITFIDKASSLLIRKTYEAVTVDFDKRGGTIRNLYLNKYYEKKKNVNMVLIRSNNDFASYAAYFKKDKELAFAEFSEIPNKDKYKTVFRYISTGSLGIPAGLSIEKTYIFNPDSYLFELDISVKNESGRDIDLKANGIDYLTTGFIIQPQKIKNDLFNNITIYFSQNDKMILINNGDKFKKSEYWEFPLADNYEWVVMIQRYFVTGLIAYDRHNIRRPDFNLHELSLEARLQERLPPVITHGSVLNYKYLSYSGPKDLEILKSNKAKFKDVYGLISFEQVMNFRSWMGSAGNFLSNILLDMLNFFHRFFPNYGVTILIVTLIIKIVFSPLTFKQYESMHRMKEVQPLLNQLKEKYKNDPQKMNIEQMRIYKEKKINPLGSCLPILIQIPVFIAFYSLLSTSIKLREESFLWIKDLANTDTLFMIGTFSFNLLPVLMTATMFIQQRITPAAGDPQQQKMMMFMPFIMLFIFYGLPSGLVLYWTFQNILSIGETYFINTKLKNNK